MITFIAAIAPTQFLAVGHRRCGTPAGITVPAGPISREPRRSTDRGHRPRRVH